MKSSVKACAVQFSPAGMQDKNRNVDFIVRSIRELARQGNELIVFPEMCVTNFFDKSASGRVDYWREGTLTLDDVLLETIQRTVMEESVFAVVGFAERGEQVGRIYNTVMLMGPDGPIGYTRKMHFPTTEKLYFSAGNDIPVYETKLGKIGVAICYDSWFPEYTAALAVRGAEIVVISASVWSGGSKGGIGDQTAKRRFWDYLPVVRAMENQVFLVVCNGSGTHLVDEQPWERMGLSKIVDPLGNVLDRVDHNKEAVLSATLHLSTLEQSRGLYTFLTDRRADLYP